MLIAVSASGSVCGTGATGATGVGLEAGTFWAGGATLSNNCCGGCCTKTGSCAGLFSGGGVGLGAGLETAFC